MRCHALPEPPLKLCALQLRQPGLRPGSYQNRRDLFLMSWGKGTNGFKRDLQSGAIDVVFVGKAVSMTGILLMCFAEPWFSPPNHTNGRVNVQIFSIWKAFGANTCNRTAAPLLLCAHLGWASFASGFHCSYERIDKNTLQVNPKIALSTTDRLVEILPESKPHRITEGYFAVKTPTRLQVLALGQQA